MLETKKQATTLAKMWNETQAKRIESVETIAVVEPYGKSHYSVEIKAAGDNDGTYFCFLEEVVAFAKTFQCSSTYVTIREEKIVAVIC